MSSASLISAPLGNINSSYCLPRDTSCTAQTPEVQSLHPEAAACHPETKQHRLSLHNRRQFPASRLGSCRPFWTRRWLLEQKIRGNISLAFYSAISHCLKCFVDRTADLSNADFSRSIEQEILAPLEDERFGLLGGSWGYISGQVARTLAMQKA